MLDILIERKFSNEIEFIPKLQLQFFLTIIELETQKHNWNTVLSLCNNAFAILPNSLQKLLWKYKIIALSKSNLNVLDAINKLKETDVSLQAQIYGIIARESIIPSKQIDSYRKAIELLSKFNERIDYIVETAQWMASAGIASNEIRELLLSGLDAFYEINDINFVTTNNNNLVFDDSKSMKSGKSKVSNNSYLQPKSLIANSNAKLTQRSRSNSIKSMNKSMKSINSQQTINNENNELFKKNQLNFSIFEIAVRLLIMLAIIAENDETKLEYCIESVYVLENSFEFWNHTIQETNRLNLFKIENNKIENKINPLIFDDFKVNTNEELLIPFNDLILLFNWQPNSLFNELMLQLINENSLLIPTNHSIHTISLTFHYYIELIDILREFGFTKKILLILSWLRLILLYVTNIENNIKELLMSLLQAEYMKTLSQCGSKVAFPKEFLCYFNSNANSNSVSNTNLDGNLNGKVSFLSVISNSFINFSANNETDNQNELITNNNNQWTEIIQFDISNSKVKYLFRLANILLYFKQNDCFQTIITLIDKNAIINNNNLWLLLTNSFRMTYSISLGNYIDAYSNIANIIISQKEKEIGNTKINSEIISKYIIILYNNRQFNEMRKISYQSIELLLLNNININNSNENNNSNNNALFIISIQLINGIIVEMNDSMKRFENKFELIYEINEILNKLENYFQTNNIMKSIIRYKYLKHISISLFHILCKYYRTFYGHYSNGCNNQSLQIDYESEILNLLNKYCNLMEECINILKLFSSFLTQNERILDFNLNNKNAHNNNANIPLNNATNSITIGNNSLNNTNNSEETYTNPILLKLFKMEEEYTLARLITADIIQNQMISSQKAIIQNNENNTIIDNYLIDTKPLKMIDKYDFLSDFIAIANNTSGASNLKDNNKLLSNISLINQYSYNQLFSMIDNKVKNESENENDNESMKILAIIDELDSIIQLSQQTSNYELYGIIYYSIFYYFYLNPLKNNKQANKQEKCIEYLFRLNSIKSVEWLHNLLIDSLLPLSKLCLELKSILNNPDNSDNTEFPSNNSLSYLNSIIAFQR